MYPSVDQLEDRKVYKGSCRNARKAMWLADFQKFVYVRKKFGSFFLEEINHPENDDGFDLFVPTLEIDALTPEEQEVFDRDLPSLVEWLKNTGKLNGSN